MLEVALNKGLQVKKMLSPYLDRGIPIVGLEPSCLFTLASDYGSLPGVGTLPIETFDTFILKHTPLPFDVCQRQVLVHGHCHQKGEIGMEKTMQLLTKFSEAKLIDSGCCGMAGSFGYEIEHEALSKKIGSLKLIPKILNEPDKIVIADGISCRSQIFYEANRESYHLADFLSTLIPTT
jgi:Fe-S oxidoreductase